MIKMMHISMYVATILCISLTNMYSIAQFKLCSYMCILVELLKKFHMKLVSCM